MDEGRCLNTTVREIGERSVGRDAVMEILGDIAAHSNFQIELVQRLGHIEQQETDTLKPLQGGVRQGRKGGEIQEEETIGCVCVPPNLLLN